MHIEWSEDDQQDPYPAAIEALGKVFKFAYETGAMSGGEYAILSHMHNTCRGELGDADPASQHLLG